MNFPTLINPHLELQGNLYNNLVSDDFVNFKFRVIRKGEGAIVIGKHLDQIIVVAENEAKRFSENEKIAILGAVIRCAQKSKLNLLTRQR